MTDPDADTQTGHPLPASSEARHEQVPEDAEARKGDGDDPAAAASTAPFAAPDGTHYPAAGSGPDIQD